MVRDSEHECGMEERERNGVRVGGQEGHDIKDVLSPSLSSALSGSRGKLSNNCKQGNDQNFAF